MADCVIVPPPFILPCPQRRLFILTHGRGMCSDPPHPTLLPQEGCILWNKQTTQMRGCLFRVRHIARQSASVTCTWQRVRGSRERESYFIVKDRQGFRYADWRSSAWGSWRRADWKGGLLCDWFENI